MKLISLQIIPKNPHGWGSGVLYFGKEITHLLAPNGAGKTPLIESIVYCLGYPIRFRADIYKNCESIQLTVEINNEIIIFSRKVEINTFNILVDMEEYNDELSFSKMLFQLMDKTTQNLITTNKTSTLPYISPFLYLHYIDQDTGYTETYNVQNNFIKDQFSEMIRLALNLPAKNIFDHKKYQLELEKKLKTIEQSILRLKEQIAILKKNDMIVNQDINLITSQLSLLIFEYDELLLSSNNSTTINAVYENLLSTKRRAIRDTEYDINEIRKRQESFEQISNEIEMEIETLTLNEKAKRLFSSYSEICQNPSCGLFTASSESYSNNLLYLKDQVKDLKKNFENDSNMISRLKTRLSTLKTEMHHLEQNSNTDMGNTDHTKKETLKKLVNDINQLKLQNFLFNEIETFEKELFKQLERQDSLSKELTSAKTVSRTNSEVLTKKQLLKQKFVYWLDILKTPNISRDISFDPRHEFLPLLGTERIKDIKGSTKVRCILAYKAALFSLMCDEKNNLNFFILDTPKQQELDDIDLDEYIKELKNLASTKNIQVVFSSSDYKYDSKNINDRQWLPTFEKMTSTGIKLHYLIENNPESI